MADVPLYQLLVQLKLTAYEQGLTDAGHDELEQLVAQCQDNEAELLSDLVNDAKMKKPKAKKLIFALRLQGSSAPPAPQSEGEEGEVDPKDPGGRVGVLGLQAHAPSGSHVSLNKITSKASAEGRVWLRLQAHAVRLA